MSSHAFLLKKAWHPQRYDNQAKVFEAELQRDRREKDIAEHQKLLKQERELEELRKLQEEAGLVTKQRKRVEWMYQQPLSSSDMAKKHEEYLLGKEADATAIREADEQADKANAERRHGAFRYAGSGDALLQQLDQEEKLRHDPLMKMMQAQREKQLAILRDPRRLRQLRNEVETLRLLRRQQKRNESDSESESDHSDTEERRRKRRKKSSKKEKRKDKRSSRKERTRSMLSKSNKFRNFGLVHEHVVDHPMHELESSRRRSRSRSRGRRREKRERSRSRSRRREKRERRSRSRSRSKHRVKRERSRSRSSEWLDKRPRSRSRSRRRMKRSPQRSPPRRTRRVSRSPPSRRKARVDSRERERRIKEMQELAEQENQRYDQQLKESRKRHEVEKVRRNAQHVSSALEQPTFISQTAAKAYMQGDLQDALRGKKGAE
ncbi:MAG: hypothetical protein MHM6MM_001984 [Cercozoa sp. M6MM]